MEKDAIEKSVFFVYFMKICALSSVVERSVHIGKAVGPIPTGRTVLSYYFFIEIFGKYFRNMLNLKLIFKRSFLAQSEK